MVVSGRRHSPQCSPAGHRFLDRNGVDVREQGVDQRQQLQLELAALRDLAVKEKLADFVGLTRRDVGENRDDALAAQ